MSLSHTDFAYPSFLAPTCRDGQAVPFGVTKRELFAAMAMQGLLANPNKDGSFEQCGNCAVAQADALLAALEAKSDDHELKTNHGDQS